MDWQSRWPCLFPRGPKGRQLEIAEGRSELTAAQVAERFALWDRKEAALKGGGGCRRATPPPEPSLLQKGLHYLGAVARDVANGGRRVPLEVLAERRKTCDECPDRNREDDSCPWCGCPLARTFLGEKLAWASEQCGRKNPDGTPAPKWGPWTPDASSE